MLLNSLYPILLFIISLASARKSKWKGSKIGTTEYKDEMVVINEGKVDFANGTHLRKYTDRKPVLCVVFFKAALQPTMNLYTNVMTLGDSCDWAIVIYDGDRETEETVCANEQLKKRTVHCQRAAVAVNRTGQQKTIPKTVLYAELLPYLHLYQRVFLLDEDISLIDFDMPKFLMIWDCSFPNQPPPLIVQPVVAETTQYFNFVSQRTWKGTGVIATASGLIEQQVPAFDSLFFEWFVRRVLVKTRNHALQHGADWGHDRSWCNAAKLYSTVVRGWPNTTFPCAILVGAPPVHHLNTHSMESKRNNRSAFRASGVKVVQKYIDLFPTWVQLDILKAPNPTDKKFGKRYLKVKKLNETCLSFRGRNDHSFTNGLDM